MPATFSRRFATSAITGSLVTIGLAVLWGAGPLTDNTLRGSKKEDMREALDHLQKAQSLLSKADHDEKGYDYQALKKTEEAIDLCKKQLGIKD
jgi:hypothetical protein